MKAGRRLESDEMEQTEQHAVFTQLLGREWNKHCADCDGRYPTWASIDFGAFICIDCAGSHRALGPTITRVRSTNLDVWKKSWVHQMVMGNDRVNQYWEAKLNETQVLFGKQKQNSSMKIRPTATRAERDRWAVVKYVRKKYVSDTQQNLMTALLTKIQNQKRIKLHIIQKIRQLESIRDEPYVDNEYQRVQQNQTPIKQYDFFDQPQAQILVKSQSSSAQVRNNKQSLIDIFSRSSNSYPLFQPSINMNTAMETSIEKSNNQNVSIKNIDIPLHFQFFSMAPITVQNPSSILTKPSLPKTQISFFPDNDIINLQQFIQTKKQPIIPNFGFAFPSSPPVPTFNTQPNFIFNLDTPIIQQKPQLDTKYQVFNQFDW